jgi:valyl-tRNA synthetase
LKNAGCTNGSAPARIGSTDRSRRERVYSIDTPPPTVSGSLHVGHVFSFTHTDTIARFQRMRGMDVFYPDGLGRQRSADRAPGPELLRRALRSVAAVRPGVRAARATPQAADRDFAAELRRAVHAPDVEDEKAFEALWRQLGLSVDWV